VFAHASTPDDLKDSQSGITLLELLIVMIISVMFSGLIIMFMFQYWRATATLNNDLSVFTSRLTAGDRLRDALNASSGLIVQNGIADANAGDPDPGIGSGAFWRPIHAIPGTTTMGGDDEVTAVLYFKSPSVNTSGNVIMNGAQPYEDEFVLYLDGTTKRMRMRVLANASAPSNRSTTTCPSGSESASCPIDRLIAEDVSSVAVRFFSRSGNLMDYTSVVDPDTGDYVGPDMPAVEVVELVLYTYKKSTVGGGADSTSQNIIRVALRNI